MPGEIGQVPERVIFVDREIGVQTLTDQRGNIHTVVISAHGGVHLRGAECVGPDAQIVDEAAEGGAGAGCHISDRQRRGVGHVENVVAPLHGAGFVAVDIQGHLLPLPSQSHMRPFIRLEQVGRQKTRIRHRVGA